MLKKYSIIAFLFFISSAFAQEYGGMWIPTELNEKEMKKMGLKIPTKKIFNSSVPSIKDAVVQFDGGCTAEVISPKGLILTNHHCGYDNIQSHSSVEKDLLTNGFWANNHGEELPNPGVTVDFIIDIKEVTTEILANTQGLDEKSSAEIIKKNIETVSKSIKTESYQKVTIKPMYYGNKYYAFVIETYKDIRLVGAPPSAIGKFGSDTDNWVFPRHTGDFSLFRIYANKNNQPAEYSKENVPYTPKYFLPISIQEKKEGDFTFVYGFPGRTQEYLPAIAVEKIMKEIDPAMISVREIALKTLDEKMRTDPATRIKYASKYAQVANYWKKWKGEVEGLQKSDALAKKKKYENELIQQNPSIKTTLDNLLKNYQHQAPFALHRAYYTETLRNAETLNLANQFYNFSQALESAKLDSKGIESFRNRLAEFYKNYDGELDAKVLAKLMAHYTQKIPQEFLPTGFEKYKNENTNLTTFEDWSKNSIISGRAALAGANMHNNINKVFENPKELVLKIKDEPLYQMFVQMRESYLKTTNNQVNQLQGVIDAEQKKYMALQMETDKKRKFFPDANSTLRVTYGKIAGSNPKDALYYSYQTHLAGVLEKYIPGDYEFDVPKKLIDLYQKKDFGIYKNTNGDVPVNFTATNHTTGGNSGSPALDANGNLIGLNFDRQWEGTMSDINFDPRFSRNIMVDTKYILFVIDKYAEAKWLIDEMKIIK